MYILSVEQPLRYTFNLNKFLAVLGYLIQKRGPMTKLKIIKLLYLLDRRHFNLYGRPVLGDKYLRMDYGPVPTLAKDLIDELEEQAAFKVKPVAEAKILSKHFKAEHGGKYPEITLVKTPDTDVLSKSEIEALKWVIDRFGHNAPSTLVDIAHRHAAWKETPLMGEIDYRLFPKDDPEAVENIAEIAALEQQERGELMEALSLDPSSRST